MIVIQSWHNVQSLNSGLIGAIICGQASGHAPAGASTRLLRRPVPVKHERIGSGAQASWEPAWEVSQVRSHLQSTKSVVTTNTGLTGAKMASVSPANAFAYSNIQCSAPKVRVYMPRVTTSTISKTKLHCSIQLVTV